MKMIVREANGLSIAQRREDGYINLTQMAQANGKKLNDYLRLDTTKAFLDELSTVTGIPVTGKNGLIQIHQGGNNKTAQGTWGYSQVAIHCAQWCSAKFAVLVSDWVVQWMTTGKNLIQPQPASLNNDRIAALDRLERSIVSIRSQARAVHTCAHQPLDELLAKSLHALSHNQLSAIVEAIQQVQALREHGVITMPDELQNQIESFANFQQPIAIATRTAKTCVNLELPPQTIPKKKQFVSVNVKLPVSQRKWLTVTAQTIRDNQTEPKKAGERVYPQHLLEVAIDLLQSSAVNLDSAYSVFDGLDESLAYLNFKMIREQQEWLTALAQTIRNNCSRPTLPAERVYPQHLIGVAIDLLQSQDVDWSQVRNIEELRERLNL